MTSEGKRLTKQRTAYDLPVPLGPLTCVWVGIEPERLARSLVVAAKYSVNGGRTSPPHPSRFNSSRISISGSASRRIGSAFVRNSSRSSGLIFSSGADLASAAIISAR